MAVIERLIGAEVEWRETDSQTNLTATATRAAPGIGKRLYLTGFSISANGQPASGVLSQILEAAVEIRGFYLPASAFAPIIVEFKHAHKIAENTAASITVPALGAGISCKVELLGITSVA